MKLRLGKLNEVLWRSFWITTATFLLPGVLLASGTATATADEPPSPAAILQDLRSFREMGSVLYVAAHPDDENTLLIAYLARGKDYRTAYLSLTRGDGGQNVLGPDFGAKLGVARTQELLAARRLDGGRQFFSRAVDFGFSKDYRETLSIWDQQEVLSDIVRVIRTFRPDVVITRFAPWPMPTHGHHTASAYLTVKAFNLAGDPKAFPEQHLPPWQPKRLFWNHMGDANVPLIHMEVSGDDPVLGISFNELAARSRAMHKTQGFGNYNGGEDGPRTESFQLLAGEPATNDIMDGIDTTWTRVPGGAEIQKLADAVIAGFDPQNPAGSVDSLLNLRAKLNALSSDDPLVAEKRLQLDHILQHCLDLEVRTEIPQAEVVPGEILKLHHTALVRSSIPVRWLGVRYPGIQRGVPGPVPGPVDLTSNNLSSIDAEETLPKDTPLSQPYWLREDSTPGMFRVADASLIGQPENPPVFPVEQVFAVGGQTLVIPDQPVEVTTNVAEIQKYRRLDVIPPVSLKFDSEVELFTPGSSHTVQVEVTAARDHLTGTVQLEAPADWRVSPENQSFQLAAPGDHAGFQFTVTAPQKSVTEKIIASATIGGVRYDTARQVINYPHIPLELLQPVAALKAVSLDLAIRGQNIGYLPGAGDSVADNLQQMGYHVTVLTDADLTPEKLSRFDAVVTGVRAFNVRPHIAAYLPALFTYAQNGGTVVEQYNRPDGLKVDQTTPYELHLSNQRVTDETAPMTFLAPDHPVLNTPNKITAADFDGWIQERGIYFPDQFDEHFTPIFACHDAGEAPLQGSLLVAPYGKGEFVYTGLDFFRELPAGVPGAYRLFANLVSLGK